MKLVQTFWSDFPVTAIESIKGGWLNSRLHLLSWALSSLLLKKYHPDKILELVCDEAGKYLLIDSLKLPYDTYRLLSFDTPVNHPNYIWITKLLRSYASHDEPFLNVDSDFFVFTKFSNSFLKKDIVVQNKEEGSALFMYNKVLENLNLSAIPSYLTTANFSVNTGIIGGNRYELFKDFANEITNFIQSNIERLDRSDYKEGLNTLLEQYFFAGFCQKKNSSITGLLPAQQHTNYHHLSRLENLPNTISYAHATLGAKMDSTVCGLIEYRLRLFFPDEYYLILKKLDDLGLSYDYHRPLDVKSEQLILKNKQQADKPIKQAYHWPRTLFVAKVLNVDVRLNNSLNLDQHTKKAVNSKRLLQSVFIYEKKVNKYSVFFPQKSAVYNWTLKLANLQLLDEALVLPKETVEQWKIKLIRNHVLIDTFWQWAHMAASDADSSSHYTDVINHKGFYQVIVLKENLETTEHLFDSLDSIIYSFIKHESSLKMVIDYVAGFYPDNTNDDNFSTIMCHSVLEKIKLFCHLGIIQLYKG